MIALSLSPSDALILVAIVATLLQEWRHARAQNNSAATLAEVKASYTTLQDRMSTLETRLDSLADSRKD